VEYQQAPQVSSILHGALYIRLTIGESYVGEVGVWAGIWLLSTSSLQTAAYPRGAVALASLSPLFIWFLLRKVGVIPKWQQAMQYLLYCLNRCQVFLHLSVLVKRSLQATPNGNIIRGKQPKYSAFDLVDLIIIGLFRFSGHGDRYSCVGTKKNEPDCNIKTVMDLYVYSCTFK